MKCSNCGNEVERGEKFCGNCGNPVNIKPNETTSKNVTKKEAC